MLDMVAGGFLCEPAAEQTMGRGPQGGYTARIKRVPVPDAAQRYARVLEILFRAKKRMEAQERRCDDDATDQYPDGVPELSDRQACGPLGRSRAQTDQTTRA